MVDQGYIDMVGDGPGVAMPPELEGFKAVDKVPAARGKAARMLDAFTTCGEACIYRDMDAGEARKLQSRLNIAIKRHPDVYGWIGVSSKGGRLTIFDRRKVGA